MTAPEGLIIGHCELLKIPQNPRPRLLAKLWLLQGVGRTAVINEFPMYLLCSQEVIYLMDLFGFLGRSGDTSTFAPTNIDPAK